MSKKQELAVLRLYRAVQNYVKAKEGDVLVCSGIQIQQWPGERANFTVAIKCTGKLPRFVEEKP